MIRGLRLTTFFWRKHMKSLRDKTVPRFRLSLIAVLLTMGATAQANSLVGNLSFSGFGNAITLTTISVL